MAPESVLPTPGSHARGGWGAGLVALLLMSLTSCTVDLDVERQALMDADRAFAQETADRGLEGWLAYFTEDARQLPAGGPVTVGHDAIRDLMEPLFDDSTVSLRWEPNFADVSVGGDLGYTIGRYQIVAIGLDEESVVAQGHYVTIWEKQPGGTWKAVVDIGNQEPQ